MLGRLSPSPSSNGDIADGETQYTDEDIAHIKKHYHDEKWRLNNLYFILDKRGKKIKFKMNWAQRLFYMSMWYLSIILKARQLGFTTFIQIFILDRCLFNSNVSAGVIAHNKEDAQAFFDKKIKYAYDNLPEWLKAERPALKNDAGTLKLKNNSSIRVGTSMRSGTLQYLHVSEFGKICKAYPKKAEEIVTGAFNAVDAGQFIFIESTAEGRSGYFFDMVKTARDIAALGIKLSMLDFKFFFFPWWKNPAYSLKAEGKVITAKENEYFKELEPKIGRKLSLGQKLWYVTKWRTMPEKMKQEFPATPDEAFEQAIKGAYYAPQFTKIRLEKRITKVPIEEGIAVDTYWDLGMNDTMVIWFVQSIGFEHRIVGFYQNNGEGLAHYARYLQEWASKNEIVYGLHVAPHDIKVRELGTGVSRLKKAEDLGIKFSVCPNIPREDGIEFVRDILAKCWFDEEATDEGYTSLENYRKKWNEITGAFSNQPLHDIHSNPADAFRMFAVWKSQNHSNKQAHTVKKVNSKGWAA